MLDFVIYISFFIFKWLYSELNHEIFIILLTMIKYIICGFKNEIFTL